MKLFLIGLVSFSLNAFAFQSPEHIQTGNQKAVFVNFIAAEYRITFDANKSEAYAESTITFEQKENGTPIYELVENALEIRLNGKLTQEQNLMAPGRITQYKTTALALNPGVHTLEIKNKITKNITFEKGNTLAGFWMSDLSDRTYLEQYLPTNLEYDQYQITFYVNFLGNKNQQEIYTNGDIQQLDQNRFKIVYPSYFTASSLYFHTANKGRFDETRFDYESINGNRIPITIYTRGWNSLSTAKRDTLRILAELENKFGAWAHPSLVIYIAGQGGMEYCGATITSMSALGHEITHSFFARGVMPVDGNAGWMDEAIASWRDKGYQSTRSPSFNSSGMAGHSQYRRTTDRQAYNQGANFMAYLNHKLDQLGGLEKFLSLVYQKYAKTNINTEIFRAELENFSGMSFEADFKKYIYDNAKNQKDIHGEENPYHPILSAKQLQDLL
jgi:hypothetical protein